MLSTPTSAGMASQASRTGACGPLVAITGDVSMTVNSGMATLHPLVENPLVWALLLAILLVLVAIVVRKRLRKQHPPPPPPPPPEEDVQSSSEDGDEAAPAPPETPLLTPTEVAAINARAGELLEPHTGATPLLTERLPISVAEFEAMVLGPGAPFSLARFHSQNGEVKDMKETEWDGSAPAPGKQRITFSKKIPVVGPFMKWATLDASFSLLESVAGGGSACVLLMNTNVSGVMYSDYFTVWEAWVIAPTIERNVSTMAVHLRIRFLKETSLRGTIESTSRKDLIAANLLWLRLAGPHMAAAARRRRVATAATPGDPPAKPRRSPKAEGEAGHTHKKKKAVRGKWTLCPCCDMSCKLGGRCSRCIRTYEESIMYPSPAEDARPFYTPCTSIGGCTMCGCKPLCKFCGCRCGLCGDFGSGAACMTVGCITCKCKPVCDTCGCNCGLCGNKGALAACSTVGCASCKCAPDWAPWGRKFTSPAKPKAE